MGFLAVSMSFSLFATTVINNYGTAPSEQGPPPPAQAPCNGNQNNIYDPRVPPAGAYVIQNGDGSSNQIYTTGEKKPYYVDNPCGQNNQNQAIYPQIYPQGPGPVGSGSGPGTGPLR